ncbi:hypothetical protein D3C72_2118250 [compost metagenome]
MNVNPIYISMLKYHERLFCVTHFLHILLRQLFKLFITYLILRIRIQRYMQDWFFSLSIGQQVRLKRTQQLADGITAIRGFNYLIDVQNLPVFLFNFELIVY